MGDLIAQLGAIQPLVLLLFTAEMAFIALSWLRHRKKRPVIRNS